MAAIISVSLSPDLLKKVDRLQGDVGYRGRSAVIRDALQLLIKETRDRSGLSGTVNCVLLVSHDEHREQETSEIKHDYTDVIQTQIHSGLSSGRCLEVFICKGDAQRIKDLANAFQKNKHMHRVQLVSA